MIEFKGECGHTIRARDEDAGKVVRCSYCGREALVSQEPRDELDLLFDEVEKTGVYDPQATRVEQRAHRGRQRAQKRMLQNKPPVAPFDPFAIALKMTYVAVIIIAVVATWKLVVPAVRDLWDKGQGAQPTPAIVETTEEATAVGATTKTGLVAMNLPAGQNGAYVSSVPAGGMIFSLEGSDKQVEQRVLRDPNAYKDLVTNASLRLPLGDHTVAIALRLNEPALMELPGYEDLRRQIEGSGGANAESLLRNYFLPDGSTAVRVERMRGTWFVTRIYVVRIDGRGWVPATALFLPRDMSVEQMLRYLPQRTAFGFNAANIERELDYYEVPETDQTYIMNMLRRVGKVSYRQGLGTYRVFQIDLRDGMLTSELIRD